MIFKKIKLTEEEIRNALNANLAKLNEEIWVTSVIKVDDNWHCRDNAKKQYVYKIAWNSNKSLQLHEQQSVWHIPNDINFEKMREVCNILKGTHNFSGFTNIKSQVSKSIQ